MTFASDATNTAIDRGGYALPSKTPVRISLHAYEAVSQWFKLRVANEPDISKSGYLVLVWGEFLGAFDPSAAMDKKEAS